MDEWAIVPTVPTEEMAEEGGTHCGTGMLGSPDEARKVYGAMLSAAPPPLRMPRKETAMVAAEREQWRGLAQRVAADANRYGLEGLKAHCTVSETGALVTWELDRA